MLMDGMAMALLTRGRAAFWSRGDPEYASYQCAVNRLHKSGLLAYRRTGGRPPVVKVLPRGEQRLPDELRPERFWNQRWNGIWYILAYDVPEQQKGYRENLRRFLKRNRMGGLQGSVWVSARDIRPVYADLVEAGGLNAYAVLLEARTVLGQNAQEIVGMAWDMDRVDQAQAWFRDSVESAIPRIEGGALARTELVAMARESMAAYLSVMEHDPLLPHDLLPHDYRGPDTLAALRRLHQAIGEVI